MNELNSSDIDQVAGGRFSLWESVVVIGGFAGVGAQIGLAGGAGGAAFGALVGAGLGAYQVATSR